jgi:hypothetical protein
VRIVQGSLQDVRIEKPDGCRTPQTSLQRMESVLISRMVMEVVEGSAMAVRRSGTDMAYTIYFFLLVVYRLRKKAILTIDPGSSPRPASRTTQTCDSRSARRPPSSARGATPSPSGIQAQSDAAPRSERPPPESVADILAGMGAGTRCLEVP